MMDEELAPPPTQAEFPSHPNGRDGEAERTPDRLASQGEAIEARGRATYAQDIRVLRARLDRTEQALRQAESEAARAPMLQAMLKDAEDALVQRHAVILKQGETLAAAQLSLDAAERRLMEAALLAERLGQAEHALAAAESANQALLRERADILGSTSWRLTTAPRRALSRLRGR